MKRLMVLSAVLCVCISVSAAPAGELTEPYLVNAARHGQTFRQEEDGALRVEFDSERHHTAGLYWKNGPALDPAVDTEAQLSIELENADRVSSISLHLRDAHREFFQFKPREQRWKDGVNVLSFSLREGLQRSNWGGGKRRNGRIDPPYYPAGVTVRLKPGSGRQHFRVLKLDFCTGGARVAEARREFIPFDDRGFLSGPASHACTSHPSRVRIVPALTWWRWVCSGAMIRGRLHVAPLSWLSRRTIARFCQSPEASTPLMWRRRPLPSFKSADPVILRSGTLKKRDDGSHSSCPALRREARTTIPLPFS